MKIRIILFFMFIILFSVSITSGGIEGNSLMSLEELVKESDLVVKGKVLNIKCFEKENGRIYSEIDFLVSSTIKGDFNKDSKITMTYLGGTLNGFTTIVNEYPQFKENEESILFLTQRELQNSIKIQYYITAACQGKFNISKNYVTRDSFATEPLLQKKDNEKQFFKEELRSSLADFEDEINLFK